MGKLWGAVGKHISWMGAFQAVAIVGPLFGHHTAREKMQSVGLGIGTNMLVGGMGQMGQMFGGMGIQFAAQMPAWGRGLTTRYRSGLESRSSAAVPFSHSNLPMDQCLASLNFARQSIGGMSSDYGQASAFASRFMSR